MKQVITFCFLLAITFNADAQEKQPVPLTAALPTAKISNGPTKEQTVDFIKDYYAKIKINTGLYTGKGNKSPATQELRNAVDDFSVDFNFGNSTMTISYNNLFSYSYRDMDTENEYIIYEKNKFIIDFKKIEKIEINSTYLNSLSDRLSANLKFDAAPNYSVDTYNAEIKVSKKINTGKGYTDITLPNASVPKKVIEIPLGYFSAKDNSDYISYMSNNKKILQAFNHLRKLCGAPEPINFDN